MREARNVENLTVVANRDGEGLKYDYAKISYLNIRILLIGGFPPVGVEDKKLLERFSYEKTFDSFSRK